MSASQCALEGATVRMSHSTTPKHIARRTFSGYFGLILLSLVSKNHREPHVLHYVPFDHGEANAQSWVCSKEAPLQQTYKNNQQGTDGCACAKKPTIALIFGDTATHVDCWCSSRLLMMLIEPLVLAIDHEQDWYFRPKSTINKIK